MSEELKPCPFCGGNNLRFRLSDIEGWIAHVECTDCDDMLGPMSEYKYPDKEDAEQDAAAVWNRRAALEATPSTDAEPVKTAPAVAVKALRDTLEWYGEQARLAKLIHSEGDPGRWALAEDGGKRANAALSAQVQDVAVPDEADIVERMVKSIRDPFPSVNLSISRGIDGWRELMRDALRAASPASKHGDAD